MTDNAVFAFTKASSDTIIVQESQSFDVSKVATDSIAVSDTPVLSPRKGLTDSVTMGDVLVAQNLVANGIPNRGLVGFMLLNAS